MEGRSSLGEQWVRPCLLPATKDHRLVVQKHRAMARNVNRRSWFARKITITCGGGTNKQRHGARFRAEAWISKWGWEKRPTTSMHKKKTKLVEETNQSRKTGKRKTYVGIAWVNVENLHNWSLPILWHRGPVDKMVVVVISIYKMSLANQRSDALKPCWLYKSYRADPSGLIDL